MSQIHPNTFRTPNIYIDRYLHLLTPEETKVLFYTVRRVLGWHKDDEEISLRDFESGGLWPSGQRRDNGTGLSRATVTRALYGPDGATAEAPGGLVGYGLLVVVQAADTATCRATRFGLQMDFAAIDTAGLEVRAEAKRAQSLNRTAKSRAVMQVKAEQKQAALLVGQTNQEPSWSDHTAPVGATDRII